MSTNLSRYGHIKNSPLDDLNSNSTSCNREKLAPLNISRT